jgi:hypothetical protein
MPERRWQIRVAVSYPKDVHRRALVAGAKRTLGADRGSSGTTPAYGSAGASGIPFR